MSQPPSRQTRHPAAHPTVQLDRLRADLEALARFGGQAGHPGVNRPSFSDADMQARRWCMHRMGEAGLEPTMDGAGNVFGRWDTGRGAAVLAGSHLDSVPMGGIFDGALGVVAALECVRAMREAGLAPAHPVEVVATSEEEGRFGGMFGAQAICGELSREWLEAARDDAGVRLVDAMARQGMDAQAALHAARAPETIKAFLELHIEQGPVLESEGTPVGIVEGISGVANWTVHLQGRANHAGTTPMHLRRDAFMGLVEFARRIPDLIASHGTPHSRVTIGRVQLTPDFAHTVPGAAEFSVVIRDMTVARMIRLTDACREAIAAGARAHDLEFRIGSQSWLDPSPCHPEIIEMFTRSAAALGIRTRTMPSGAGHDTQVFARHTRAGMIFVPSIGGISHAPEERTGWDHVETGTRLLLYAIMAEAGVDQPRRAVPDA